METTTFDLEKPYLLASDQITSFRRDGHVCLRNVASPGDIEYFRPLILDAVLEAASKPNRKPQLEDTSMLFMQATNVWQESETLREFVCATRFATIAAELMGVRKLRLYHDQAMIKFPGGRPSPWHKDHYYWPLASHQTIKMWLALSDIPLESGAMTFASGSHRSGLFPELPITNNSQDLFDQIIRDHNFATRSCTLAAGDATFYSGDVLHCARENSSTLHREAIAVIYFADGTTVTTVNHQHRMVDLKAFLPGLKPGDLAATEFNPILYDATL